MATTKTWVQCSAIYLVIMAHSLFAQDSGELKFLADREPAVATISEVSWIAGHWLGQAFGGEVEEIWTEPMAGIMMCMFRAVSEEQTSFFEFVTISEDQGSLLLRIKHFNPDLSGWEEKDESQEFRLVAIDENHAWFDGFTFEKVNQNRINIYVLFSGEGEPQEIGKFEYHRKSN